MEGGVPGEAAWVFVVSSTGSVMFDLSALEEAFAQVEDIGSGWKTFEINGSQITLRIIYPKEEAAVTQWAGQLLENADDEDAPHVAIQFLDRFKIGLLSYAIQGIGGMDLRGVEYVPTGKSLDNGKPVQIPKYEALRTLCGKWSRLMLVSVFRKYMELAGEVERKAERAIEFEPTDLDAEIARLERRLLELKEQKEEKAQEIGVFQEKLHQVAEHHFKEKDLTPPEEPEPPEEEPNAPVEESPPQPRQRIAPMVSAPPPAKPRYQPPAPEQGSAPVKYVPDDSFVSSDSLESAVAEENARLAALYRKKHAAVPPPSTHMEQLVAEKQEELVQSHQAVEAAGQELRERAALHQQGSHDGVPVYRGGEAPEVLGGPAGGVPVNQQARRGRNPRFAGPKKTVR